MTNEITQRTQRDAERLANSVGFVCTDPNCHSCREDRRRMAAVFAERLERDARTIAELQTMAGILLNGEHNRAYEALAAANPNWVAAIKAHDERLLDESARTLEMLAEALRGLRACIGHKIDCRKSGGACTCGAAGQQAKAVADADAALARLEGRSADGNR